MFTKYKETGRGNIQVRGYKKVINWDSVFGVALIACIVIAVIANH